MSELQRVEALCTGRVPLVSGSLGVRFVVLHDGELSPLVLLYSNSKALSKCRAGEVWSFSVDSQHSMKGNPDYVGPYEDDDKRMEVMTSDQARETARRASAKKLKDSYLTPVVLEAMRPLRLAYKQLDYHGQRALELMVLEWLRR